ncbi:hypothetical protein MEM_00820 [Candida albicans L26]|uniref:Sterol uptake control protein 2 n=3 Tax=Candida albicans TaxID=5476 RepID=UPC2_CANAL|nr:Upc2p [Candida albicans SC5314]Q59QC7.1 RecName: Full=Sterol uptake control protein 2 [Candida albicans SC5314]ACE73660.1 Upc2 [Candida albicans]KGQ97833.1 hypothetical protein MEU_00816 [Candida albicans P37005]KGR16952.1 hypothetical protein MG3_00861 [Candida albicans P78048]KGR22482.1 hypothetical protein MG9_00815 [Candida albicans P37037]KGT71304.1 hypothetical protein MEK_00847 [Candida albicans 12C]KGU16421.1 hypothetical protein MEY_00820 [Candida albicans 19F]KGU17699.1 hypothe|eukprot:XP_711879.1 Upc2p [Candida albicans SC5314]
MMMTVKQESPNSTLNTSEFSSDENLKTNNSEPPKKVSKSSTGKRKYHQKSRNGCSTCKKRRVKCDEQRPVCGNCTKLKLDCGYLHEPLENILNTKKDIANNEPPSKKRKRKVSTVSAASDSESTTQQATPSLTPSPNHSQDIKTQPVIPPTNPLSALSSGLLSAGNLNNLNVAHLVNNLSGLGDLSNLASLGNLASLSNLASLAQLPIDLSNLGSLLDSPAASNIAASFLGSAAATTVPPTTNSEFKESNQRKSQTQMPPQPTVPITSMGAATTTSSHQQANMPSRSKPQPETLQSSIPATTSGSPGMSYPGCPSNSDPFGRSSDKSLPNISPNMSIPANPLSDPLTQGMRSNLNMLDLKLMFHYTSVVANTITGAGISDTNIWNCDIPKLAFEHPFLMHSILAFSATHLSRTEKGLDQCVTCHRGDALRLLREAVLNINADNTDALVASALILIMDSLANASFPSSTSPKSLPASAWIFHVKGAATILTAVWPLTEASRFYKFISVDLGDLGDIINQGVNMNKSKGIDRENSAYYTDLECHDADIADLFPVLLDSPYLITLAYLNKLHKERYKSDFILRIFAFPALLDKQFMGLLMSGDVKAMRIMRSYYKLLRSFTTEMKDKVWFLEGVSQVLPVNVEEYAGGAGGMHMMMDFLGGGPAIVDDNEIDAEITKFDPSGTLTNKLIDTDNLPSVLTSNLDLMQGDNGFMNMK